MNRSPAFHNCTKDTPKSFFNTVALNDVEGLIRFYAHNAIEKIQSNAARRERTQRGFSCMRTEEKKDESFQVQSNIYDTEILAHEVERIQQLTFFLDSNEIVDIASVDLGTQCPTQYTTKQEDETKNNFMNFQLKKVTTLDKVERVLREGARILSNSHPDNEFVVYSDNKGQINASSNRNIINKIEIESLPPTKTSENTINDNNKTPNANENFQILFDGGVANSTPVNAPLGGRGGRGTILHLSCVLDLPFVLSLLLVMGADASNRHTAFCRLIVHEAACSDSPKCLRLLLELSKILKDELEEKSVSKMKGYHSQKLMEKNLSLSGTEDDNKTTSKEHFLHEKEVVNSSNKLSHIDTLRISLYLWGKVKAGEMSEIEASHFLLKKVQLSYRNKVAIVSSCLSSNSDQKIMSSPHENNSRGYGSNSDCHGNTAIHWAAFKNSTACVSILLSHQVCVNTRSELSGWTPLHDAAYSDAAECVDLLVAAGADINAKANSGATPLCFAAQEDASKAALLLLEAGADASVRCCGQGSGLDSNVSQTNSNRFSGYTPLHYCAHYNAHNAARVLLQYDSQQRSTSLLETSDLNKKLPIHVAVARGSSDVLRELLHGGTRIDRLNNRLRNKRQSFNSCVHSITAVTTASLINSTESTSENSTGEIPLSPVISENHNLIAPVSSPLLQSLVPIEPVRSTKPWNRLTQHSINECKNLIQEADCSWSPVRHSIFHPKDRLAVVELLKVGKRFEQMGTGIFLEVWIIVLGFCGRGWFDPFDNEDKRSITFPEFCGKKLGDISTKIELRLDG